MLASLLVLTTVLGIGVGVSDFASTTGTLGVVSPIVTPIAMDPRLSPSA
jgi:hypothetical protein